METIIIQSKESRINELRRTPHTNWSDPGHGWLEAKRRDLELLGIERLISGYSYANPDGKAVYLEEDQDATTYLTALFGERFWEGNNPEFTHWRSLLKDQYREYIFIRSLPRFKA